MSPQRQHLTQAAQLLRLRQLRQEQAHTRHLQALQAQAAALATVRATQAQVAAHRQSRSALLTSLTTCNELPRWADLAQAQREVLEDRLERAEYALIDDEEDLLRADRGLDQAGQAWRQALARRDGAEQALQRARSGLAAALAQQAEREDPTPNPATAGALR